MPILSKHRPSCVRCGSPVQRVHRQPQELRLGAGTGLRRYACVAEGCGWQGLLPRHARSVARSPHRALKLRRHSWLVPLVLLVVVGVGLAAVLIKALYPNRAVPFAPVGENRDGGALLAAHLLDT